MRNIQILLLSSLILFLTACTTSTLTHYNDKLTVRVDDNLLQVHGRTIKANRENFSILFLNQKLIQLDDKSLVMYEFAKTDFAYEFARTAMSTIKEVFDARQIVKFDITSQLFGYQLLLKDGRVLNMLAAQSYNQELTIVYGMSSNKLDKILKKFNPHAKPVPYRNVISLKSEPNPLLSNWTTWKINFVPLVQPLPRFFSI